MSASKYCGGCGFKNDYSGISPKFCGNCGDPFDKAFKVEKVSNKSAKASQEENDEEEASEEVSGLRFQIKADASPHVKLSKEWAKNAEGVFDRPNVVSEARAKVAEDKDYTKIFNPQAAPTSAPQQTTQSAPADI